MKTKKYKNKQETAGSSKIQLTKGKKRQNRHPYH